MSDGSDIEICQIFRLTSQPCHLLLGCIINIDNIQNIDFWKYIHNFENDFLYFNRPFNLHPKKLFRWCHLRFFRDWTWKKYSTHVGTFKAFWTLVCFNLLFWSLALSYRDSIKCLGNVGSESIAQIWNTVRALS